VEVSNELHASSPFTAAENTIKGVDLWETTNLLKDTRTCLTNRLADWLIDYWLNYSVTNDILIYWFTAWLTE